MPSTAIEAWRPAYSPGASALPRLAVEQPGPADGAKAVAAYAFPLASLALRELLAGPVPDDPVKDELWVNLVVGLAQEQLEDALVDATVR